MVTLSNLSEPRSPEPPQFGRREMECGMKDRQMGAIGVRLVVLYHVIPTKKCQKWGCTCFNQLKKWKRDMTGRYMACGFIWAWHDRNWDRHMTVKRLLKQTPMVQPAVRELDVDKICQSARFAYNIVYCVQNRHAIWINFMVVTHGYAAIRASDVSPTRSLAPWMPPAHFDIFAAADSWIELILQSIIYTIWH